MTGEEEGSHPPSPEKGAPQRPDQAADAPALRRTKAADEHQHQPQPSEEEEEGATEQMDRGPLPE